MSQTIVIQYNEMQQTFNRLLLKQGFEQERAENCARIFVENSLDGIYSHGVNRFPRFIRYIKDKLIDVRAYPALVSSAGAVEQWDGRLGPGPLNALFCADRVMEKAAESGIACLAIANTNHWMRGGRYGWHAAKKGFAYIAWTNTIANMPAWGAMDQKLGNNPLILAVPYQGEAIVLDMALSQFSYGKIEEYKLRNEPLPLAGGFDLSGQLTRDPAAILKSERALPAGYWKGAGLALLLDILAAILSGGLSTADISRQKSEHAVSQVFIAIDLKKLHNFPAIEDTINWIISDYLQSIPENEKSKVVYPGQRVLDTRCYNNENGMIVDTKIWQEILSL